MTSRTTRSVTTPRKSPVTSSSTIRWEFDRFRSKEKMKTLESKKALLGILGLPNVPPKVATRGGVGLRRIAVPSGPHSSREHFVVLSGLNLHENFLGLLALYRHAHGDARADDLHDAPLEVLPRERVALDLRDLDRLLQGDIPDHRLARLAAPLGGSDLLEDERGHGRRADLDRVRLRLRVDDEGDGALHPVERLRLLVDVLYDLHDVKAEGTEGGAEWRARGGLAAIDEHAETFRHGAAARSQDPITFLAALLFGPLLLNDAHLCTRDRDGDRHDRLEELDRELLLRLVDLVHARLLALERPCDELDDVALHDAAHERLRREEVLDLLELRLPDLPAPLAPREAPRAPDAADDLLKPVGIHGLDEDVAPERLRREDREDADVPLLRARRQGVRDRPFVADARLDRHDRGTRARADRLAVVRLLLVRRGGGEDDVDLVPEPDAARARDGARDLARALADQVDLLLVDLRERDVPRLFFYPVGPCAPPPGTG